MKLALGTAQFGLNYGVANANGQVGASEVAAILELARLSGIDTIDTAAAYGDSEVNVGRAGVSDFKVVTKLPPMPANIDDVPAWVRGQIDLSLERLGISSVYGYLLHRPEQLAGQYGPLVAAALKEARQDGLISLVGISIYDPEQIADAMRYLDLDLVQAPLNLLDRRIVKSGWADRLRDRGIQLHTRSSFLQGLLLMERDALPPYFSRWRDLLDRWHDWIAKADLSATRACLGFVSSRTAVDRVIVGVDTRSQLATLVDDMLHVEGADLSSWPAIQSDDPDLINPSRWLLN